MTYNNPFSDKFFSQGHRTLTQGTFIFGGILFLLAILIFAYPMLIAYFIAGVILLVGTVVLTLGWKLWQVRDNISHMDYRETPVSFNRRTIYFRWHV